MDKQQLDDLMFYCWQLKITTLLQLANFKQQYNIKTNEQLLDKLCKLYNSNYYYTI